LEGAASWLPLLFCFSIFLLHFYIKKLSFICNLAKKIVTLHRFLFLGYKQLAAQAQQELQRIKF
jgi:hypothetical protein